MTTDERTNAGAAGADPLRYYAELRDGGTGEFLTFTFVDGRSREEAREHAREEFAREYGMVEPERVGRWQVDVFTMDEIEDEGPRRSVALGDKE
jgi:hypothetical protein